MWPPGCRLWAVVPFLWGPKHQVCVRNEISSMQRQVEGTDMPRVDRVWEMMDENFRAACSFWMGKGVASGSGQGVEGSWWRRGSTGCTVVVALSFNSRHRRRDPFHSVRMYDHLLREIGIDSHFDDGRGCAETADTCSDTQSVTKSSPAGMRPESAQNVTLKLRLMESLFHVRLRDHASELQ